MLDILHFIFRSFWTWLGSFLLLAAISRIRLIEVDRSQHYEKNNTKDYK